MSQTATKTFAPAKCAWCGGSGKWRVAPGNIASCVVCGGKGQVSVSQPTDACLQCEGMGRSSLVSPCLSCAGTGWGTYLNRKN
jgi:DnaJ-class molecular chaperone